jgi:hypothetical protein
LFSHQPTKEKKMLKKKSFDYYFRAFAPLTFRMEGGGEGIHSLFGFNSILFTSPFRIRVIFGLCQVSSVVGGGGSSFALTGCSLGMCHI